MYPSDWPKCVWCGDPALDGHLTCGKASCGESEARFQDAGRAMFGSDEE